jgi:hypothetical protein
MDQREERRNLMVMAELIVAEEAAGFRNKLLSDSSSGEKRAEIGW